MTRPKAKPKRPSKKKPPRRYQDERGRFISETEWKKRKTEIRAAKKKKKREKKRKPTFKKPGRPTNQDAAAAHIRGIFIKSKEDILDYNEKLNVSYRVYKHKDGSVDGELRVFDIPRGLTPKGLLLDIERLIPQPPEDFWIQTAWLGLFDPEHETEIGEEGEEEIAEEPTPEDKYKRYMGLDLVATYPHKGGIKKPYAFLTTRQIAESLSKKRRRKPFQFLIRIFWNPEGVKPDTDR